ncbi:thioredoxin reductase (NADPH) [Methanolobus vulcani]|uniref:Thioredoxin reductase (NADPH) n=1 Tax=Methanolobus vulcani TaxID=38026 RepID=A0A7Z7AXM6_9EURY|nr:thioredoxin-disulfide reductase [Methanolobus vulcani]SDF32616.1 thioredoxin reductase (NADPH) [Methanolobus vulcani]
MYDLVIIGGGPAGMTAGIYAVRYGLDTLVLEKNVVPGQIATADRVENYPGFSSISGMELMNKFREHAEHAGVSIRNADVKTVKDEGDKKVIITDDGDLEALAVIVATGANPRRLGVPGEDEFLTKGVSYCATCDGPFYSGLNVIVVGGGESAVTDALILSDIAEKVYVVHRRDELRACSLLQKRAFDKENITFIWDTVVQEIQGEELVERVVLRNTKTDELTEMEIDGIFIYVGINPNTSMVDVEKKGAGFIVTDEKMECSVPGIFAAGDCRRTSMWQVVTAVSDGAVAAISAHEYITSVKYDN